MCSVNIHQAKIQLSKLVDKALHGEETIITKAGVPVAKLIPIFAEKKLRYGVLKGKIQIADDFDAPLADDLLDDFQN